jgi:hypothetical protein
MVGMEACIRDEGGNFIAAMTTNADETMMTAVEGEARSLYQGTQWVVTYFVITRWLWKMLTTRYWIL